MLCGCLFLILPLFCSAASTKPSIYIPKKLDDKPRNTQIDFDGQKWKFKLADATQLSAYFISKSPAAVSFDLFVPDSSKLTEHTKIEFDFGSGQKISFSFQQNKNGKGFTVYEGYDKALFTSNELLVSITVFANGTAFFQAGEKNTPVNLKTSIPFLDIGNSTSASGFTLTGANIVDFLEIYFKPGNVGFDKNLDPKQPVADAFVGSIGFYAVVVIGVLVVFAAIGGFIGWKLWKKRKLEKAKILVDDKKAPNNDGKKASDVQSTEKKETNDNKKAMIPKTDAEKKSKNEQKNEDKKPANEKASHEKLKEKKTEHGKEERIRVVNELAAPDERTESKMNTKRQKKSWTERKPVNEMTMKTSGEISSTQVPTLDQTQEQFSAKKPKGGGNVGLKQRFRGENGPPPPRTESQRSKKKPKRPKKKPSEKQESKKSSDETSDETDDDDTLKGVKSLEKNPNIPDTVDDAEVNEK
uniref:Uncharacterized protein n=1 Tax=Panagrolaimus sp. JU765 TaxID=591449 RepID=A0AC34R6M9_9BILA